MQTLRTLDRLLAQVERGFILFFLAAMLALTFFQVVLRGLFTTLHVPWANLAIGTLDWAEPFVRLTVLWIAFLAASLVTAENRHIKIDLLSNILPSRWLPLREVVLCAASAAVCALLLKASLDYLRVEMSSSATLFLGIPVWVTQIILPAGFFFLFFRFVVKGAEETLLLKRRHSA